MEKLFLTAAALMLTSVSAHARPVQLPDDMLGKWCFFEDPNGDKGVSYFYHADPNDPHGNEDCHDIADVQRNKYKIADGPVCTITKVKRLDNATTNKLAYLVQAHCAQDESSMFQLIGGQLIITPHFREEDANWSKSRKR